MRLTLLLIAWVGASVAKAGPYQPLLDNEIIETLPNGFSSLRAQMKSPLQNPLAIAREHIRFGQSFLEPRYVQSARTIVQPATASLEKELLLGIIEQYLHDFPTAVSHFRAALQIDPENLEAIVQLGMIHTVKGELASARELFSRHPKLLGTEEGFVCLCIISSLSGDLQPSYRLLESAVGRNKFTPEKAAWVNASLAEMAIRLGDMPAARGWLERALLAQPDSLAILAQWFDFCLATKDYASVAAHPFFARITAPLSLRLRQAIALEKLGQLSPGDPLRAELEAWLFNGEERHAREQARFLLELKHDYESGLKIALRNFQVQREPADVLLILEAANGTGRVGDLKDVLLWMRQTKLEDSRASALLAQLKSPLPHNPDAERGSNSASVR